MALRIGALHRSFALVGAAFLTVVMIAGSGSIPLPLI